MCVFQSYYIFYIYIALDLLDGPCKIMLKIEGKFINLHISLERLMEFRKEICYMDNMLYVSRKWRDHYFRSIGQKVLPSNEPALFQQLAK